MLTKRKLATILRFSVLIILTVALAIDQFAHQFGILWNGRWITVLIVLCFLLSVLAEFLKPKGERPMRKTVFEQDLFLILYVIGLVGLFTYLGGESQVGISLTHPILWIFVVWALIKWRSDKRAAAKKQGESV